MPLPDRLPRPLPARLALAFASLLALVSLSAAAAPERIAWVWDNARIPPWSQAHAAVLVRHVWLTGDEVRTRSRADRPAMGPATRVTPVVHVEVSTVRPPVISAHARAAILDAMQHAAAHSSSGWVQLDMEARPSQREDWLALVRDIRAALPPGMRLSVTALAWWCRSGAWLDTLAADEVVPMLFRMGRDGPALRTLWLERPQRLHLRCRAGALGTGTPEPLPDAVTARYARVYAFDAARWRGGKE